MNQICSVTKDLNNLLSSQEWKKGEEEAQEVEVIQNTMDLMYGDNQVDLKLHGEAITFDTVIDSLINHDDFKKCLLEVVNQEYLPLRDLIRECAEKLVRMAE